MKRFIKVLIFFLILFSFSLFLAIYVKDSNKENKYDLQLNNQNNIIISVGYYLIKPLIEIYIDSRLDNYGLFDGIRSRLFYNKLIGRKIIKNGDGYKIQCGDKIKINTFEIKTGETNDLEYTVGKNEIPILNIAPIGMQKNEETLISVPKSISDELLSNENNTSDSLKIEIIDIEKKDTSIDKSEPLILEGRITNKKAKLCGEKAFIRYTIYDIKGKKISSDTVDLKIGNKDLPFENFIIGMQPLTKKIVVLKSNLINNELNGELKILLIELVK